MNWDQLKTILWLRWRLTRNQWRRSGGLGAVLAAIVAVTASSLSLVTAVPLTRGGLDPVRTARHIVSSSWIALVVIEFTFEG